MEGLAQHFRDIGYDHIADIFEELPDAEVDQLRSMFEMPEDVVIFVPREWSRAIMEADKIDLISGWMTTASELADGMAGGGEVEMFNSAVVGVTPDHIANVDIIELVSTFRLLNGGLAIYATDGVLDTNVEEERDESSEDDFPPPPDGPADLRLAIIENFARYLLEHDQITLGDIIMHLPDAEKIQLEGLMSLDNATQFFIPSNDQLRAAFHEHPDKFNLIRSWMVTMGALHEAIHGDKEITMLDGSQFIVVGDSADDLQSVDGKRVISTLDPVFYMGVDEIFVSIVDGVLQRDPNAGPLDPNAITSAAQADATFRELMNRAMDLAAARTAQLRRDRVVARVG